MPGPVPGVTRSMLYDYAGQPHRARFTQLVLAPETRIPAHVAPAMIDVFVLAGEIRLGQTAAESGCCVTIDPDTEFDLSSRCGW